MLPTTALLAALLATGAEPGELIPIPFAARPLVQPHRTYEIFVETPLMNTDDRGPVLGLDAGARYGFSDDFEAGVLLIPVTFYKGVTSAGPSAFFTYRFISGLFELGASLSVSFPFPIGSTWTFDGSVPMLIHGARIFRLDFGPHGQTTNDASVAKRIFFPIRATVQLDPVLRVALTGSSEMDFKGGLHPTYLASAGGEVFYTITGSLGPAVDLGATFSLAALPDSAWIVSAAARFYAKAEFNPLDEPF